MTVTILVLLSAVAMFITGKPRADIVALCALTILVLCGILSPAEALSGFSNPVVVMMAGLFVAGGAILQTGLAKAASRRIMQLAGSNDTAMFLLVVVVTALIGAFVSNTGTVALMMPIIVSMAMESKKSPARLLMPLAFASSMGGMLTLIGTPPNLVIDETLREAGYDGLSFFSFLPVGIICLAVGIAVMLPLSKLLVKTEAEKERKSGKSLEKLVEEYRIDNNVGAYRVDRRSSIVGMSVAELNLRAEHNISIMEIRNETLRHRGLIRNITQSLPTQATVIAADDILYLQGPEEERTLCLRCKSDKTGQQHHRLLRHRHRGDCGDAGIAPCRPVAAAVASARTIPNQCPRREAKPRIHNGGPARGEAESRRHSAHTRPVGEHLED